MFKKPEAPKKEGCHFTVNNNILLIIIYFIFILIYLINTVYFKDFRTR